jgi:hypothetical protein
MLEQEASSPGQEAPPFARVQVVVDERDDGALFI